MKHTAHILPLLLVLLLLAGCGAPAQKAVETPAVTEADFAGAAAENYIRRMAETAFLTAEPDLRAGTVAALRDDVRVALPLQGVKFVPYTALGRIHAGIGLGRPELFPNDSSIAGADKDVSVQISDGMDYVLKKSEYARARSTALDRGAAQLQLTCGAEDVQLQGDFAQVIVRCDYTAHFPDASDRVSGSAEADVILCRHDGQWLVLDITADDAVDRAFKWREFDAEAEAAKRAVEPTALTNAEIARANEALLSTTMTDDGISVRDISPFFMAFYISPEEIPLKEFLRYNPAAEQLGDSDAKEFQAVVPELWPDQAGKYAVPGDAPQPAYRYPRAAISAQLEKYAGITTDALTNAEGVCYLNAYDAYYNAVSDFGPGSFICAGGEKTGDVLLLWTEAHDGYRNELTLRETDGGYRIQSFLPAPV